MFQSSIILVRGYQSPKSRIDKFVDEKIIVK